MGYMGLEKGKWFSDMGADLRVDLCKANGDESKIHQHITRALKDKGNEFNPDGAVHIALLIEDGLLKTNNLDAEQLKKAREMMQKNITTATEPNLWDDEKNRKQHLKWYQRLHKVLNT